MRILLFLIIMVGMITAPLHSQNSPQLFQDNVLYFQLRSSHHLAEWELGTSPKLAPDHLLFSVQNRYGITQVERPFDHLAQQEQPLKGGFWATALAHTYRVHFTANSLREEFIKTLEDFPEVVFAEAIPQNHIFPYTPNDPDLPNQWGLSKVQAFDAWDLAQGGPNVNIAIVDDAVRLTHQDLAGNIWSNPNEIPNNNLDDDNNGYIDDINGWDAADNDNNPAPPAASVSNSVFTHGTHCAGIAAGVTDNNTGIASIAFEAKIIAVKCNNDATPGPFLPAAYDGVSYAIAAGADVISMSWGGAASSIVNQNIMNLAHANGIVLVAAAGNADVSSPMYPASYTHVINVGATNTNDQKASFSNYGATIDVMAPGDQIYSTLAGSDQSYGYLSGTSMACPLVAGLSALMLSYDPGIDPDSLEGCLKSTCDNIDAANPTYIGQLGAGRVNAFGALTCLSGPPLADFTSNLTHVCPGSSVTFTDLTLRNPTAWSWTFSGPITLTSTQQNPVIVFNTAGTYQVALTATNSSGTNTETRTAYLVVGAPTATLSGSTAINAGDNAQLRIDFMGSPPFNFTWTDGTTPTSVSNITANPYFFTVTPGQTTTYTLTSFSSSCTGTVSGSALVEVNQGCNSLDAGGVLESCGGDTVQLDPYLGGLTAIQQLQWQGGNGTFLPNRNTANAQYIPSAAEVSAGSVNLTISVTYQAPGGAPDTLIGYEHGNNDVFVLINESSGLASTGPGNFNRDLTAMTYDTLSQTLYGFGGITGSKIFYAIDPPSFTHTNISTFSQNIYACSFDHDSRTIWASVSQTGSNRPQFLYTIDPATGAQTQIGAMGINTSNAATFATGDGINGMAYDSQHDILYGISNNSHLYSFNTTTGAATQIGATGILNPRGMAYDLLSDKLYVIANLQTVYVVDPATGTVVQTIPPSGTSLFVYTSLAYIPNFAPGPETCLDVVTLNFEAEPQLDLGADTVLCTFAPLVLDATLPGAVSWQWSDPDSTGPQFTATSTGDYWVEVTTANCFASDTISISAQISVSVSPSQAVICEGEAVQLTGTVTGSTLPPDWSPSGSLSNAQILDPFASPSSTTWYVLTVNDGMGCEGQDSAQVVVEPAPLLPFLKDSVDVCYDDTLKPAIGSPGSGIGNDFYEWTPADHLSDPFAANPLFCPDSTLGDTVIVYVLTITNTAGCQVTDTIQVSQERCLTNLDPWMEPNGLRVYPNPVNVSSGQGHLFVEGLNTWPEAAGLIDALGRWIEVKPIRLAGSNRFSIDLSNLAKGLYILNIGKTGVKVRVE